MSNGKGDTPRPILDKKRYDANWDRIFGAPAGEAEKEAAKVFWDKIGGKLYAGSTPLEVYEAYWDGKDEEDKQK